MLNLQVSTIVFQMLNFLILLVVLTKFFYQPALRVMNERDEAIAARLRAAEEQSRQAEAERERLAGLERDAAAQADALLASARADAQEAGKHILGEARSEAARLLDEARRTVDEQEPAALARVEAQVRETAVRIAGSLIRQAAGPAVHQVFVERLFSEEIHTRRPEATTGQQVPANGQANGQVAITVEAAYPLTAELETRLRARICRDLGLPQVAPAMPVRIAPELVAGLRILAGDSVLDFSLQRILRELQEAPAEPAAQGAR